jgi:voltage-gated potassium channel
MPAMRDRFNAFVERHEVAWELAMAALAIVYVAIGFAIDEPGASPYLVDLDRVLTAIFLAEFAIRIAASRNRGRYLREHFIDLVALIPLARGLRVLRLLRLLRPIAGTRRAFLEVDRLADHHGLGSLVIAWFGVMFLAAWGFLLAEGQHNPDVNEAGDAIWWGLMTLTNGPTDVVARTTEGQWITAFMLVVGVALFGAMTAVLVSYFVSIDITDDATDELRALARLRDEGLITPTDYESTKARILERRATQAIPDD